MNRDEAIEAGAKALDPDAWELLLLSRMEFGESPGQAVDRLRAEARKGAAAVIDAALPHLVEPVGYAVVDAAAEWISTGHRVRDAGEARDVASRLNDDGEEGHRVVALIPIEEP